MKLYINLTNGIQAIKEHGLKDYRFVRIQSTACEQKRWGFIIQEFDNTLLMELALGYTCIIYDYSQHGNARAIWQGVEWIRYALNRYWLNKIIQPKCNGHIVSDYFNVCYQQCIKGNVFSKKLKYFKKILKTEEIKVIGISGKAIRDGDYDYYRETKG